MVFRSSKWPEDYLAESVAAASGEGHEPLERQALERFVYAYAKDGQAALRALSDGAKWSDLTWTQRVMARPLDPTESEIREVLRGALTTAVQRKDIESLVTDDSSTGLIDACLRLAMRWGEFLEGTTGQRARREPDPPGEIPLRTP